MKKLKDILESIYELDQSINNLITYNIPKSNELFNHIHDHNQSIVIQILNKYGWLSIHDVGEKANKAFFLTLLHSNIDIQTKYITLLEQSISNNESKLEYYPYLKDQILINKGLLQLYGTQARINKNNQMQLLYLAKPKEINILRSEYNLNTLEEYAINNNYLLPMNY